MRKLKVFIIYFPVLLVSLQVIANMLALISWDIYNSIGFYLNTFLGTNMLFAFFLVAFTYMFKFCTISRVAAWTEVAFGVNYLIVQQDNLYNILFQIISGSLAVFFTFRHYIKKFPFCRLSLLTKFLLSIVATGSCAKGVEKWEKDLKNDLIKRHYERL
jgi:hypothetical protein